MTDIADERAEAAAARARLLRSIDEVRYRLDPQVIVAERTEAASLVAASIIDRTRSSAAARPWIIAIVATLIGVVLVARAGTDDRLETNTADVS